MLKIPTFLYRNKFHIPSLPPPESLSGQYILVAGANTGIGQATALHCLNLGAAQVIITSKDAARGAESKRYIEENTTGKGTLKVMHLEMGTFARVKEFADELAREEQRIDTVLLNAGVMKMPGYPIVVSKEGCENTLQVNTLSTALLAILLLPWLRVAGRGKARLTFTGSGTVHRDVDISPKGGFPQEEVLGYYHDPENCKKIGGPGMYGISKLFLEYVMQEVSKLALGADGKPEIIVTSACPGSVKSDLGRDAMANPVMGFIVKGLQTVLFKTAEQGAITLVYGALTPAGESGRYFTHYHSYEGYKISTEANIFGPEGQKMRERVWGEIVVLLADQVPQVKEIVHSS